MSYHNNLLVLAFAFGGVSFFYSTTAPAQDAVAFACIPNDSGRSRLVASVEECRPTETAVALAGTVSAPAIEPIGFSTLVPRGNSVGCDLRVFSNTSKYQVIAVCNTESDDGKSGLSIFADLAPDPAYRYDGLYLCIAVDQRAIDRDDGFGDFIDVSLVKLELADDGFGVYTAVEDGTPPIASWSLDEINFPFQPTVGVQADCATLKFADADSVANGPFLGFQVPDRVLLWIRPPDLAPRTSALNDGDSMVIYDLGLTISGYAE